MTQRNQIRPTGVGHRPTGTGSGMTLLEFTDMLEPEGAFLTPPVLKRVFPNGIPRLERDRRALVRERLSSFLETDTDVIARGTHWRRFLLHDLLEWGAGLREGQAVPAQYDIKLPQHNANIRPDAILASNEDFQIARALIFEHPLGTSFDRRAKQAKRAVTWAATPLEQAEYACRETGVPIALLTDGENITLLWAPRGAASGSGTFTTTLFAEEPVLLDGFVSLLEARRFFATGAQDTLEALFHESAEAQAEVTITLGRQVRSAVELLISAIGRADREQHGDLLRGISPSEIYSAAVTVLMRLVFLLTAEERGLFPLSDRTYASSYAVASLRDHLREQARWGLETLERRTAAWHRLLALFRAIHGGVDHSEFRLPAYGGSLFAPDRFPFLEGRSAGTGWQTSEASPLPVDDRTVLAILDALKVLRIGGEARTVSYRTLDIEQIGHVYEGLLDHGCVRADEPVLGFIGRAGEESEIPLSEAEEQFATGPEGFGSWIQSITGLKGPARAKAMVLVDGRRHQGLSAACEGDPVLILRILPFLAFLRSDVRGEPLVMLPGSLYCTRVSARRDMGAQYTTKELADELVRYTLEPLVYRPGPAEGAEPKDWRLINADEILKLKICDPAVGSGAILVAAGRYLAERLLEAWAAEESAGHARTGLPAGTAHLDDDEVLARRAVTDHCLYGVDRDPLAAEMAKLSLWLSTLSRERPFTFLDHAIQCGDSLLGITGLSDLDVLYSHGRLIPTELRRSVETASRDALTAAQLLIDKTVLTVRDAEDKSRIYVDLLRATQLVSVLSDAVIGSAIAAIPKGAWTQSQYLAYVSSWLASAFDNSLADQDQELAQKLLSQETTEWLDTDNPQNQSHRAPLHWPLAFPEVFLDSARSPGFDAFLGNPPFLGGTKISGPFGAAYRHYLAKNIAGMKTDRADLVCFFFLRSAALVRQLGTVGLLATNSIAQTDSSAVGLDPLLAHGFEIYRAVPSRPWPGNATLEIAQIWMTLGSWNGIRTLGLDNASVSSISSSLTDTALAVGKPFRLRENEGYCLEGSKPTGSGFVITEAEASELLSHGLDYRTVVQPYLSGQDLNSRPDQSASRWIVFFGSKTLEEANSFPIALRMVELRVKPGRLTSTRKRARELWWQFEHPAVGLYRSISKMSRVLVMARVSKSLTPAFVKVDQIFSDKVVVFKYEDSGHFGLFASSFHSLWADAWSPTLRLDPSYNPSDSFETFPQPRDLRKISNFADQVLDCRAIVMAEFNEGITNAFNRFHDPAQQSSSIVDWRNAHVALDTAVSSAYGWERLSLTHGFHPSRQGLRFTVAPDIHRQVLDMLLALNHTRYAEEEEGGIHEEKQYRPLLQNKIRPQPLATAPQLPFKELE
jgi:hypothetical protein